MALITNFEKVEAFHAIIMYLDVDIANPGVLFNIKSRQQLDTSFMDEIAVGSIVGVVEKHSIDRAIIVDIDLSYDNLTIRFKQVTDAFQASPKLEMYRKQYKSRVPEANPVQRELDSLDEAYTELMEKFVRLSLILSMEKNESKVEDLAVIPEEPECKVVEDTHSIVIEVEEGLEIKQDEEITIVIEDGEEPQKKEAAIIRVEEEPVASISSLKHRRSQRGVKVSRKKESVGKPSAGKAGGKPRRRRVQYVPKENDIMVQIGDNGTMVGQSLLDSFDLKDYSMVARGLLEVLFGREKLATHTLSGKPSPAFDYTDRERKEGLDKKIIQDIIQFVSTNCPCSPARAKGVITTKCADETKMAMKRKLKNENKNNNNNNKKEKK